MNSRTSSASSTLCRQATVSIRQAVVGLRRQATVMLRQATVSLHCQAIVFGDVCRQATVLCREATVFVVKQQAQSVFGVNQQLSSSSNSLRWQAEVCVVDQRSVVVVKQH
jgi:hypothetical protein